MKWIESKEALLMIIKHGPDIAEEFQRYLDCDLDAFFDCEEVYYEDTGLPLDFEEWLESYEEGIAQNKEFFSSPEWQELCNRD
jgi:hypothetical protein